MSTLKSVYDLDVQLERAVGWLKFAETKNAISLTMTSGLLFAIFRQQKIDINNLYAYAAIGVLLLIIILLIYSFIPRLSWSFNHKSTIESPNLHYFGHISMLSLDDYRNLIIEHYKEHDINSKYFRDTTNQIKINCDIAMYKFCIFNLSCKILLVVIILLAISA